MSVEKEKMSVEKEKINVLSLFDGISCGLKSTTL